MSTRARLLRLQQHLTAKSQMPQLVPVVPVLLGPAPVGQASLPVADQVAHRVQRAHMQDGQLRIDDAGLDFAARTALLDEAAHALREAGHAPGWRDEQLDVRATHEGQPLASIERAACRPLGIATRAVHMNGVLGDGRVLVARRAEHKRVDPGLWDNLVGGMVSAGESDLVALAREAYEEAGLDMSALQPTAGNLIDEARPVQEGYLIERIQVFDVVLPASFVPHNVDGEVAAFAALEVDQLLDAFERDEFTLEAALVTLDHLIHRSDMR